MTAIFAMVLVSALFAGPLVWSWRRDRTESRADAISADIRAAINRRLGGESMVSVLVVPASHWRAGRIVLSAPSGYEYLVEGVWRDVIHRAPAGYEVVTRTPVPGSAHAVRGAEATLPRAA